MREQAVGRSSVPVHRVRRDIHRIARVQHLRLLTLEADAAHARQTKQRLSNRVGCHAVRAPGVNVTTEPPRRDGASAVITGSWNTTPVKVSAAPRLVFRAPARMTPALTGMTVLLQWRLATDQLQGEHSGRGQRGARKPALTRHWVNPL